MKQPKSLSRKPGTPAATYVGAAQFKATCLEMLDRVQESGHDVVVTKHGRPVARVVPYAEPAPRRGYVGCLKGSVLRFDRPFDPIEGEWDLDRPGSTDSTGR